MLQQHCLHTAQLMHLRSLWQPGWHHVTVKDNQSQSMGQCWEMGKKNKIQIKSQIMLLVTFIPALPKKCLYVCFVFAYFLHLPWSHCLCKLVMTVVSVWDVQGGRTWMPFSFLRHRLTFNNNVAVTLQSKSFKRNLMWNSIFKILLLWVFNWIFLKLYFLQETLDSVVTVTFWQKWHCVLLDPLEPALYGWDSLLKYIM